MSAFLPRPLFPALLRPFLRDRLLHVLLLLMLLLWLPQPAASQFVHWIDWPTLTTLAGYTAPDADLTITIDRAELEDVMIGAAKLVDKVKAGTAKLEGKIEILEQLKATLVAFDPFFEVLPGTRPAAAQASRPGKDEVFEDDAPVVKEP